ncbi:uncharacterized protein LOC127102313 [Lathyrus oleraceus]|uniref:uncharacterized protein LOC127102313 n=1 Tax=Pisum sativum TaxID=3888 RepID=UPI0021CE10AB|nr:uncharacterized protein LOC127102313 [Pisum sativum]
MEAKVYSIKKELQSLLGKINFLKRFRSNISGKTQAFSPLLRLKKECFEWGQAQREAFEKIKDYLVRPPIFSPPCRNKSMRLYISVSDVTLGSMLSQEDENGVERAIYYLSQVLNDVETRYSMIEKLCLSLYFSCTKLKHYIKLIDVYVSSHFDSLKHVLSKPILHNRIGKWAPALTEYSLTYMPLKAIKGYRDGTIIGVLIISPNKIPTKFKYKIEGLCSNNEDEHEALIAGLEILLELGETRVKIMSDSELVIKQITKEYKCAKENLIVYFVIENRLLRRFKMVSIRHIPRVKNQKANDLAQIASGYIILKENLEDAIEIRGRVMSTRLSPIDLEVTKLGYADKENFEILSIDSLTDEDWRKPIVKYLENPTTSAERKVIYHSLSYTLMGNELFKKTPEGVLLKCLGDFEVYLALSNVHSGACGAHQVCHKMKWLLFRQGMY